MPESNGHDLPHGLHVSFFFHPSSWPVQKVRSGPLDFDQGLKTSFKDWSLVMKKVTLIQHKVTLIQHELP